MQWLRRGKEEDPSEFWRQTAARRGGEIGFFTFATLLGKSGGAVLNFPGLLYTVGDTVWFEDFERDNWLSRILSSRQKYEKTEMSFSMSEVKFTRVVSRGAAARCIGGAVAPDDLATASIITRVFSTPVAQIGLHDGPSIFLEVMQRKELFALLAPK
jgi:hypothetical protein